MKYALQRAVFGLIIVTIAPILIFSIGLEYDSALNTEWPLLNVIFLTLYASLMLLGMIGFLFSIPALCISVYGIRKNEYLKLNYITLIIATIILIWNVLIMFSGGFA